MEAPVTPHDRLPSHARDAVSNRRQGDSLTIPGNYQHQALTGGPRVQRYWHTAKLELLDWFFPVPASSRVLDIGAGSGVFANKLALLGASVVAIDSNQDAVDYAQSTFGRPGAEFKLGQLDDLDLPPESFDIACCLEVVEHVYPEQVNSMLNSVRRLLRPGGRLLLTTPNYHGLWPAVEWLADRLGPTAHMQGDQHVTRFSRARITGFVHAAGFEVESVRTYCTFAPFVAGLSWDLAERVDRLERRLNLPFGNLIALMARRQ